MNDQDCGEQPQSKSEHRRRFEQTLHKYCLQLTQQNHQLMNDSFKLLVKRTNRFGMLFWTLAKGEFPLQFLKSSKWVYNYHLILKNEASIYNPDFRRCQFCAKPCRDRAAMEVHLQKQKTCEERYEFMNFHGIYVCQFGCEGAETMDKTEIAKHLILKHKAKEVAVWGYRKDKLKRLLSREQL